MPRFIISYAYMLCLAYDVTTSLMTSPPRLWHHYWVRGLPSAKFSGHNEVELSHFMYKGPWRPLTLTSSVSTGDGERPEHYQISVMSLWLFAMITIGTTVDRSLCVLLSCISWWDLTACLPSDYCHISNLFARIQLDTSQTLAHCFAENELDRPGFQLVFFKCIKFILKLHHMNTDRYIIELELDCSYLEISLNSTWTKNCKTIHRKWTEQCEW